MQITKQLTFNSDFGNIVYDKYLSDTDNGVIIQIAHGMIEHRGRYGWLCQSFARAGYIVFINDHRGHGDSISGCVRHGEMGKSGFEKATEDMFSLRNIIAEEYPGHKLVLFGHSMGSLLARRFLQRYANNIDALILSGSPSPERFLLFGRLLFNGMYKLGIHTLPRAGDIFSFAQKFKTYCKKKGEMTNNSWVCSDEHIVKSFLTDNKCQFRFTTNSFADLLAGMHTIFSTWPQKPQYPDLPVLFLSGAEDICGKFGKGVIKARDHLRAQGYNNITLKLYTGMRHEIFNEPDKNNVLDDTLKWLKTNNLYTGDH